MSRNVARAVQSIPLNSIDLHPAKASIAVNRTVEAPESDVDGVELSLVIEAIGEARMLDKEFALNGGMDPAQWSRIKGGIGNLPAKVLLRQPAKFWIALDRLQRTRLGVSDETQEAIRQQEIELTADALWNRLVQKLTAGVER